MLFVVDEVVVVVVVVIVVDVAVLIGLVISEVCFDADEAVSCETTGVLVAACDRRGFVVDATGVDGGWFLLLREMRVLVLAASSCGGSSSCSCSLPCGISLFSAVFLLGSLPVASNLVRLADLLTATAVFLFRVLDSVPWSSSLLELASFSMVLSPPTSSSFSF